MPSQPLCVLSTLALKGVLEKLRPKAELRFDATQAILKRIADGERADVLILTAEAIADLQKKGRVRDVRSMGSSGVGVAVRAGAPRPDIGSVEAFWHALVSARSVAHSRVGASGLYFAKLLEQSGKELKKRIVVEKGPVALVVASGEAEIGIQQLCELAPVPGIDIVGPLPGPLQALTHFAAGVTADAAEPGRAAALIGQIHSAIGPADHILPRDAA
jgi:molybdate transport system substrate-binding protein